MLFPKNICVWLILLLTSCGLNEHKQTKSHVNENIDTSLNNKRNGKVLVKPTVIQPVNEAGIDSTLVFTIKTLKHVVKSRDTQGLFSLMHKNVISSHGGAIYGYDGVIETWEKDNIWNKLEQMLNLGGAFNAPKSEYRIPYIQVDRFYKGIDLDWYVAGAILDSTVLLFQKPDSNSTIIDTLSFDIIEVIPEEKNESTNGFVKISPIKSITEGFVKSSSIYRTQDYMLVFEKDSASRWLITSFAPYD
jgi:hypothetical protein